MSKHLKVALALGCLVCVLAIFIAPTIDMPETVLRSHHAVRTMAPQAAVPIAAEAGLAFAGHRWASDEKHSRSNSRTVVIVRRKVFSVMRC